ncbi:MAG: type II toxin-antitoxin system Phd/YefM family antitoxin [Sulfurovum sp.]
MKPILARYTASITELKKSPTQLLSQAGNEAIAILNHNVPSAYLVPSELYEKMIDLIDEYQLAKTIQTRLHDNEKPVKVALDDLLS